MWWYFFGQHHRQVKRIFKNLNFGFAYSCHIAFPMPVLLLIQRKNSPRNPIFIKHRTDGIDPISNLLLVLLPAVRGQRRGHQRCSDGTSRTHKNNHVSHEALPTSCVVTGKLHNLWVEVPAGISSSLKEFNRKVCMKVLFTKIWGGVREPTWKSDGVINISRVSLPLLDLNGTRWSKMWQKIAVCGCRKEVTSIILAMEMHWQCQHHTSSNKNFTFGPVR